MPPPLAARSLFSKFLKRISKKSSTSLPNLPLVRKPNDQMRMSEKQRAFSVDLQKLLSAIHASGMEVTQGWGYRDIEIQKYLKRKGASKTLKSLHIFRCAIDLNLFIKGKVTWVPQDYMALGLYWEGLDPKNKWGGRFGAKYNEDGSFKEIGWDARHFQRSL